MLFDVGGCRARPDRRPATDFQQYTWEDWAELILGDNEPFIQAVTFRLRVAEVLTLTEYDPGVRTSRPQGRRHVPHNLCAGITLFPGHAHLT